MSNWPTKIEGNAFSLSKLDPDKPPAKLKVVTWSNVFGKGGSVAIEAYGEDGNRFSTRFGSIEIEESRSVISERECLQDLVDSFAENYEANWSALITAARTEITDYYRRQAQGNAEKLADAEQGVFS